MVFHKSYRDAVLRIMDGGTEDQPLFFSDGSLTIKWVSEKNQIMNRGSVASGEIKSSDEGPAEVSFSYILEGLGTLAGTPSTDTAYEMVTNTADGANWVSTRSSTNVFCLDILFQLLDKDGSVEEAITMSDFYYTSIDVSEGDPSMVTITGRAFEVLPVVS